MSQGGDTQPGPGQDQPASGAGAWAQLGRLIRERRAELGLTQREVQSFGGPSAATLYQLESGQRGSYRPHILRRLERALGWGAGSVRRVLAGGLPVLDDDVPASFSPSMSSSSPAPAVRPRPERPSRPQPDHPSGMDGLEWVEGFRRLPIDPRDKLLLLSSLIAETIADIGTSADARARADGRGGSERRAMSSLSRVPIDAGEDGWIA
jgi:DNA-binding XRE family transcriptional regulator